MHTNNTLLENELAEPLENTDFLTTQIITYLGNKRSLLGKIEQEICKIKKQMGKSRIVCADLFSGSGIVSRMMKKHSAKLIVNDLENYSYLINSCYLSNKSDFPKERYDQLARNIKAQCAKEKIAGIITKNYAPQDDNNIQKGERVFYTHQNALLIDTYRTLIDKVVQDDALKKFFFAPLITEASIHVNTSGVFKGFYKDKNTGLGCFGASGKDALPRIIGAIELKEPVFSNFASELELFQTDAVALSHTLHNVDVAYLDPPYNQHPYGSNYFMLNLIIKNKLDVPTSEVSGITQDWNRSTFNVAKTALHSLEEIVSNIRAAFIIISYNSEGFISLESMTSMLCRYGTLKTIEIPYNTFRGSRNLKNRDKYVSEYLFVLQK